MPRFYVSKNERYQLEILTLEQVNKLYCYDTSDLNIELTQNLFRRYKAAQHEIELIQKEIAKAVEIETAKVAKAWQAKMKGSK